MDTLLLKAFIAVAETSSFSVAAEQLYLTQSAVSKRINLLEQQLDCRLFDRIARSTQLTESGDLLLPKARTILQALDDTRQLIHDLKGNVNGRLRLAISHHIGLHRLPAVLKDYIKLYPEVMLDVEFLDSEQAYKDVQQGKYELGLITLAPEPNPKIVAHTIWQDSLAFVAASDHKLIINKAKTLEELEQYPAILPELDTYTSAIVADLFKQQGLNLQTALSTNYLETIKAMTAIGMGWSLLPHNMLDAELAVIPISEVCLKRHLGYIYHRERTLSNAARCFIELLQQ